MACRGFRVKVFYNKGSNVVIYFPATELKQALGVLKALAMYFKAPFLLNVAERLENDLTPKLSMPPLTTRICENCFTEIDISSDEYVHVDDTYMHRNCPALKQDRP